VDAAITFVELRRFFQEAGVTAAGATPSDFDPPRAGEGGLFAISRGLLQASEIGEDLVAGEVVAAEGRTNFVEAIREFQTGDLDARLLEVLCCNGCIMGAGMSADVPLFRRRSRVSEYVRERLACNNEEAGKAAGEFADLDLTCTYRADDQRLAPAAEDDIRQILAHMGKLTPADELNCGACGYDSCREHAVAVLKGLAESEMCLPYTIDQLRTTITQLGLSNEQLVEAQEALMQSEKLASMGQLAAGVAHEVNNPLGVVLMYAHLLLDEFGGDPKLCEDLTMIAEQADRCKKIVAGLLHFSRQNRAVIEPVDLPALAARTVTALRLPEDIAVRLAGEMADPIVEADGDQLAQVLTNLITNAAAAMNEKGTLGIECRDDGPRVKLIVSDTGCGIPKENLPKLFEPFFTTKQIGKGTGLGLAITYGIVKMHFGDIRVESNADPKAGPTGTTFTVTLPRKGREP
jgi:signal transduction histidine kinase